MRTVLLLLCSFIAAPVHAQLKSDGGIFGFLRTKPFMARVTTATTSESGYTLAVQLQDGGIKGIQIQLTQATLDRAFVAQLETGRMYAFPQCLIDFLGLDETVRLTRTLPPTPTDPQAATQTELMELGKAYAFRATVLDTAIYDTSCSIVLQCADSRLLHACGSFEGGGGDKIKSIAERLRRGESYEFPAALEDVLLSPEARVERARPKTPETAVLARYIGSWKGTLEDAPTVKILMNCHWLADGTGIWMEITSENAGSKDAPTVDIARITYDAETKSYASAIPSAERPHVLSSQWKEATQTFVSAAPTVVNGQQRSTQATFTSAGHIAWETVTKNDNGKVLETRRGGYVRTSRTAPATRLPPAISKALMAANAAAPAASGMIGLPMKPAAEETDFFKLWERPPFRSKITDIKINDEAIQATLERGDLRQITIRHARGEPNWEKALVIAKRLQQGSTHEFPAALADDYEAPSASHATLPCTTSMRALAPFIGQWTIQMTGGKNTSFKDKIWLHYFWSHDGTGLWRETHVPAGGMPPGTRELSPRPFVVATYISFDSDTQSYYEIASDAPAQTHRQIVEWDAAAKTYTVTYKSRGMRTDVKTRSTRRFVSHDCFEFHSKSSQPDGTVLNEATGFYKLIQP